MPHTYYFRYSLCILDPYPLLSPIVSRLCAPVYILSHCLKVSWHWSCHKRKIGRHDVLYPAARDQTHGYTRLGPSGTKCTCATPMRLNPLSPAASFGPWNMRYCGIFINIDTPLEKKNTLQVPFAHYNEYHKNLIVLTPQRLS